MKDGIVSKIVLGSVIAATPWQFVFAANKITDEWKEAKIETHLNYNDVLDQYDINVEVKNNVAHLKGQVSSGAEKELAGEITKSVEGINSVDNNIVVDDKIFSKKVSSERSTFGQKMSDATTTAKVKSKLLWSKGIPSNDINVETSYGTVTLKGKVHELSQKTLAEKLVERTYGVRKVVNQITVDSNSSSVIGSVDLKKVENNAGEAIDGVGETLSDAWISWKVSSSLRFTRGLNIYDLEVESKAGAIRLTGMTHSSADKELATEIASEIKGVKSVTNEIKEF